MQKMNRRAALTTIVAGTVVAVPALAKTADTPAPNAERTSTPTLNTAAGYVEHLMQQIAPNGKYTVILQGDGPSKALVFEDDGSVNFEIVFA